MAWGQRSNRIVPSDWGSRKRNVLERDHGICHACGHAGAEEVDHLLNVARGGTHDYDNLAPIHGAPCPTCGKKCHASKTAHESHAYRPTRKRPPEPHPGLIQ